MEGTGFYALQSCMNHSCVPNAHAMREMDDVDATSAIRATAPIRAGDEVEISYIDEVAPLAERRAALADYGFVCRCRACVAEGGEA